MEKYSHPQALVDLLKAYVGKENLEPMLMANNAIAPMVIQVNTLKTTTVQLAEELTQPVCIALFNALQVLPEKYVTDTIIRQPKADLSSCSVLIGCSAEPSSLQEKAS